MVTACYRLLLHVPTFSMNASAIKIAKVNLFHKKDSKPDISNYQLITILSNLDKILEKLMYTRIFKQ